MPHRRTNPDSLGLDGTGMHTCRNAPETDDKPCLWCLYERRET